MEKLISKLLYAIFRTTILAGDATAKILWIQKQKHCRRSFINLSASTDIIAKIAIGVGNKVYRLHTISIVSIELTLFALLLESLAMTPHFPS